MNAKTTIEVSDKTREKLRAARKDHERNYNDTIERLLGEQSGGQLWTEREIQDVVDRRIEELTGERMGGR